MCLQGLRRHLYITWMTGIMSNVRKSGFGDLGVAGSNPAEAVRIFQGEKIYLAGSVTITDQYFR